MSFELSRHQALTELGAEQLPPVIAGATGTPRSLLYGDVPLRMLPVRMLSTELLAQDTSS